MTAPATPARPPAAGKIDPGKARLVQDLKQPVSLLSARFDPSGAFVFAGAWDNTIFRWRLAGGQKTVLKGHKSWVRALAFAGGHLYSADYAGVILAWPAAATAPPALWYREAHRGWVRALAASPDGRLLASCGNDGLVKLWSLPQGRMLRVLEGHGCHVYNVAFHPDGKHLVSADLKGVVRVWESATGRPVRRLDASALHKYDGSFQADIGGARGIAFDPSGGLLACSGITDVSNAFAGVGNPLVVLFDWTSGKVKTLLRPKAALQGTAWGVAIHPQGWVFAAGGGHAGALWAWRPDAALAAHTVTPPAIPRDLTMHPSLPLLALPCHDGGVRIYDVGGGVTPAR